MTTVRTPRPSLNLHSQESAPGEKQEPAKGEPAQRTNQEPTHDNQESAQRGHHESVLFNLEGNTGHLTLQKLIHGGRGVSCMQLSIANCNCSIYSYHSVARFGSALHQKHWHRKHLRWAPEQRRAPKAPFSASLYNSTSD